VNADGSPIGNLKSYEISAADNGSNPTNPSNPTNSSNIVIVDTTHTSALDTNNQIKESARSFWSSDIDGKKVDKGGVGEVLLSRSKPRNIFANIEDSNLMTDSNAFSVSNQKITPELLGLSPGDVAGREKLIQYVHGYDSYVNVKGKSDLKKRKWMLGAIINSQPLVIPYEDSRSVIYVGANDGMLHAFDNATGEELWGFIPYELLGRLKEISQNNALKYFVDGSPKAYIANSQTIIIFGLGKGGSHYYALDVTNPDSPKFLWKIGPETTGFSELGQAWSTPQIRKVKYETGERAVCFIGGGYDENQSRGVVIDKRGRAVYAIDVVTGTQIWRWDHGKDGNMNFSIPSDISCVDTNGDGYIDRLYVGDTGGRLWRFDIKESGPNSWSAKMIFDTNTNIVAGSKRKIFYRPDVTLEKGYEMVFFGTGDREHSGEIKVINQIYAIKDKGLDKPISMSNLENVTYGASDLKSLESKDGWFINLEGNKGEKVLGPPVVIFGVTYFSTFTPSIGNVNGTAQLYALDYKNGNPILNLNPSNDQDGVKIDLSDRSKVIGIGIPSHTVISAIDSLPIAFTGFSGGVYNTPLRKNSTIIPIWWKEVSKK
jgi:type IV pilus assembly protein PilY1